MGSVEREGFQDGSFEVPRTFDGDRGGRETEPCEAGATDGPAVVGPRYASALALGKRHLPLEELSRWTHSCNASVPCALRLLSLRHRCALRLLTPPSPLRTSSSNRGPAQRWCLQRALRSRRPAPRTRWRNLERGRHDRAICLFFFISLLTGFSASLRSSVLLVEFRARARRVGLVAEVFAEQMTSKSSALVIARVCSNTESQKRGCKVRRWNRAPTPLLR